jgi:hypothetical protein
MANGTLTLWNKLSNTISVDLVIVGTFNIEDNLNDTPSNMKIKTITSATYREEFEVNTVAWHEQTDTWWVIKSDTSTYMNTGEYEHELELVEYLEFYGFRHLPNCAFAPNTYTLEQMLDRLFNIAKLSVSVEYATFLDKDKIMPFMSFENFTVANAIKTIARAIDAIPKMYVDISESYEPTLYFINRVGLDTAVVNGLNTNFPSAYEKNTNSSDQFTTRSIANIQNAKSSNLVIAPKSGGFKMITPNSLTFDENNAIVFLPSKIDKIDFLRIYPEMELVKISGSVGGSTLTVTTINRFRGYYFSKEEVANALSGYTDATFDSTDIATAITNLPEPNDLAQVNTTGTIDKEFESDDTSLFEKKMIVKSKFDFDTESSSDTKARTAHWLPFTNQVILPLSVRNGIVGENTIYTVSAETDHNSTYTIFSKTVSGTLIRLALRVRYGTTGFFSNKVPNDELLIQVGYYPIADIKISLDNDDDAQDEKFFNQNGKVIDALSASRLVFSHTQDSVNGTKIRNARYDDLDNVLPLGQLVRDGSDLYVVTQRSLDLMLTTDHEWINVIYTLTKNRIGRSENIVADSSVISYKIPDDNLVNRTQLYKDYIELSLTNGTNDTPYLPMSKAFVLGDTLAGTDFDFTLLAKNDYGATPTIVRYIQNPSVFDIHKSKLMNANWQDNNILGFRLDSTGASYVQTPISYTDNVGKATDFELVFMDTTDLENAKIHYEANYTSDPIIPFADLTQVNSDFYDDSVLTEENYSIKINEPDYNKDAFEIPVFEYMVQANDDYDTKGNIVVGDNLFSTFTGELRYHYLISSTRFTSENALRLYNATPPSSSTNRRVTFTRTSATQLDLDLYSTFSGTRNATSFANVGFFVTDGTNVKFLFAINDYTLTDYDDITVYINNWKI